MKLGLTEDMAKGSHLISDKKIDSPGIDSSKLFPFRNIEFPVIMTSFEAREVNPGIPKTRHPYGIAIVVCALEAFDELYICRVDWRCT